VGELTLTFFEFMAVIAATGKVAAVLAWALWSRLAAAVAWARRRHAPSGPAATWRDIPEGTVWRPCRNPACAHTTRHTPHDGALRCDECQHLVRKEIPVVVIRELAEIPLGRPSTEEEKAAAARMIRANAQGPDDETELLAMLDLTPAQGER
jgi:hypothetical protein